jgi:triphosphoribosyl-dephospho-CoA synthetase
MTDLANFARAADLLEQYAEEVANAGEHGDGGEDEGLYHELLDVIGWARTWTREQVRP